MYLGLLMPFSISTIIQLTGIAAVGLTPQRRRTASGTSPHTEEHRMQGRKIIGLIFLLSFFFSSACAAQTSQIDSLRHILPAAKGDTRFAVLFALANKLEGIYPKEALAFGAEAMIFAVQKGNKKSEATLLASASFCYSSLGDFDQAIQCSTKSLTLGEQLGDKKLIASARSTLGTAYVYIGQFSKALECHLEALRLREELGLEGAIVISLNNIGIVYHNIGQYDKAIEYYKKALTRLGATTDTLQMIRFLHNIGFAELKRGNYERAETFHTEALRLAEKSRYVGGMAYSHFNLGVMYAEKKNYVLSVHHMRYALDAYRTLDQKPGIAQTLVGLGTAYYELGQNDKAKQVLLQAAALSRKIHTPRELMMSYETLASLYDRTGPTAMAYEYFRLYSAAKDSLFNTIEGNKIAEISMNLEVLKNEREMEALKQAKTLSDLTLDKRRYQLNLLTLGIVSLSLIILLLYWYIRTTKKSRRAAERKNVELEHLNAELQERIGEIRTLSGLLPICSNCKKIRNDSGYWEQLEGYILQHSDATFSHGICPDCMQELYPDLNRNRNAR